MRVLVVDDEPLVRRFLERLLDRLVEHVEVAEGGHEALERVTTAAERPSLVLSDLSMPRLNGIELARCLHRLETPPPVVLLTAYDPPEVQDLLEQGLFAGCLHKPPPLPQLVELLERHAGGPR